MLEAQKAEEAANSNATRDAARLEAAEHQRKLNQAGSKVEDAEAHQRALEERVAQVNMQVAAAQR